MGEPREHGVQEVIAKLKIVSVLLLCSFVVKFVDFYHDFGQFELESSVSIEKFCVGFVFIFSANFKICIV